MAVNPLAGLVMASRDVVFTGHLTDPVGFAWAGALAIAFFFAWRVFHQWWSYVWRSGCKSDNHFVTAR